MFSSVTVFIVVINLCLYIGLFQFCGILLFLFLLYFFLILFFKLIIFSTFIPFFAFPNILCPCALHYLEHPERFTELQREEKREEGDRGDWEEQRGSQNRRGQSSQQSGP